ncbi:nucleoid-associated protein [Komagataeibacter melomenusus]
MNNIINAAVHDLQRGPQGFKIVQGQDKLVVTHTVQRVINELHDLYARRASKSYGKFSDQLTYSETKTYLGDYLAVGPDGFADLTAKMMVTLQNSARTRNAAAGGHVFFAHFERDNHQYLLVAIITDKLGANLTGNLDVQDVVHLDVDGFRFAGRINMTAWLDQQERYIGFLKGKGSVSEYFKEFLGCDTVIQARQDTSQLVETLKEFTLQKQMSAADREEFLTKAKGICERLASSQREIDFEEFANELFPSAPTELSEVLGSPERKLNDGFIPDRRALVPLKKFKGKTSSWSVEFDRQALTDGSIIFDADANTLTFKGLPVELVMELKRETIDE